MLELPPGMQGSFDGVLVVNASTPPKSTGLVVERSPLGAAQQFMLDQDTGGAIRAAGRTDLYTGVGDEAEKLAGEQLSEGELYYLVVKEHLVPQYLNRGAGANYSADSD